MAENMPRSTKSPDDQPEIVDINALVEGLNEDGTHKPPLMIPTPKAERPADEPVQEPVQEPDPAEAEALRARLKEVENQLAVERGSKDPETELEVPDTGDENIVIHIVANGFTALGNLWYVGQELEFDPRGKAYQDTKDKLGRSWLDLRGDEAAQIERYGEVKFKNGPWVGKTYADAAGAGLEMPLRPIRDGDSPVLPPTQDELHAAASMEARRRRAAPRLPMH